MIPGRVSIIVPTRNEQFHLSDGTFHDLVGNTVRDLASKARGDIEIIAVLDGYWPDPPLPVFPSVVTLHTGGSRGMRPAINAGVSIATGEYLMKIDGHCCVDEGFDITLKSDYHERNWIVVPRRDRLDPDTWSLQVTGKPPIDAHYLSNPYERLGDPSCGLHGTVWPERTKARAHILLDEEMSSQGSCWFMHRDHWARLGPMDVAKYGNFIQEFQELGLKTWLGGGKVMVNKKTTYLHLHKGKRFGRGYFISKQEMQAGADFATAYWMVQPGMQAFIERFSPVPTWPADLDTLFKSLHTTPPVSGS